MLPLPPLPFATQPPSPLDHIGSAPRPPVPAYQVFRWEPAMNDWGAAQSLAFDFNEVYSRRLQEHNFTANPGVERLLDLLNEFEVSYIQQI